MSGNKSIVIAIKYGNKSSNVKKWYKSRTPQTVVSKSKEHLRRQNVQTYRQFPSVELCFRPKPPALWAEK